MINYNDRIIIGTAQFSNNYGLSKVKNNIPSKHKLLDKALEYKCHGRFTIPTGLLFEEKLKF